MNIVIGLNMFAIFVNFFGHLSIYFILASTVCLFLEKFVNKNTVVNNNMPQVTNESIVQTNISQFKISVVSELDVPLQQYHTLAEMNVTPLSDNTEAEVDVRPVSNNAEDDVAVTQVAEETAPEAISKMYLPPGLQNCRNICFANSILQMLARIELLVKKFEDNAAMKDILF